MESTSVDGQDVEAVYETTKKALRHAREGKGPVFVVADCVRLSGHYVGDPQVYRPKEEILELRKSRDPIELLRARLALTDEELEEMDREATRIAEESVEFSKRGTDPKPASGDTLMVDVSRANLTPMVNETMSEARNIGDGTHETSNTFGFGCRTAQAAARFDEFSAMKPNPDPK